MKCKLLLSSVFLSFALVSSMPAQWVFPRHSDHPVWQTAISPVWFPGGPIHVLYQTSEEVVLCGELWTPVYWYEMETQHSGLTGYYRITGDSVWFRAWPTCSEAPILMYDFSMQPGDVVHSSFFITEDFPSGYEVDFQASLSWTEEIQGYPQRNLLHIFTSTSPFSSAGGFTTWKEGVGDVHFPFYPRNCIFFDKGCQSGYLICLSINGQPFYSGEEDVDCLVMDPNRQRWYVDKDASGLGNGADWENAFNSLQQALFFADGGDSIWVAEGVYLPTHTDEKERSFHLKSGVAIYGGFSGHENNLEERNWKLNATILSGNIGSPIDSTDNVYHVLQAIGVDSTALLDGFIIKDGHAIYPAQQSNDQHYGGGLFITGNEISPICQPVIRNCHFSNNTGGYGGAVSCRTSASTTTAPSIQHCLFTQNKAAIHGGGLYINGDLQPDASIQLVADTFIQNTAWIYGGGVHARNIGTLKLQSCLFDQNRAIEGAGAIFESYHCGGDIQASDTRFTNNIANAHGGFFGFPTSGITPAVCNWSYLFDSCSFEGNQSLTNSGGGLAIYSLTDSTRINIQGTSFFNNSSLDLAGGFFLYQNFGSNCEVTINRCEFGSNITPVPTGGIFFGMGILDYPGTEVLNANIENSLFYKNSGAFSVSNGNNAQCQTNFRNCTFFQNKWFPIAKNNVSGENDEYNNISLTNCILWEQETYHPGIGGILYNGNPDNINITDYQLDHSIISADHCFAPGYLDGVCSDSVWFQLYPSFLDTLNNDFRLSACSPALNLGRNDVLDALADLDLAGQGRIKDEVVDLGAYERSEYQLTLDEILPVTCYGGMDGQVLLHTNGEEPVAYTWVLGDTLSGTGSTNLIAGDYLMTLTDASGCQDSLNFLLTEPDSIHISSIITHATTTTLGSIEIQGISGGHPPYQLLWNTGSTETVLEELASGVYELQVTDSSGCVKAITFEVQLINAGQENSASNALWRVFPNPAKVGKPVHVYWNNETMATGWLSIYDSIGRNTATYTARNRMELYFPAPGVYLAVLYDANGQSRQSSWIFVH
ncbi:MAG TPA: hypothetical protein PKA00_22310 [Saprospiraceae bacterium]|nr:hypothetical protein [Saprospiraceae bacterium]HMQ85663.1 hypothetical protein [Saprospiraceae bacterium]